VNIVQILCTDANGNNEICSKDRGKGHKEEWWWGWIQLRYSVRTIVNVTMYSQYINSKKIYIFICLFVPVYLSWWSVCSDLLPIVKLSCSINIMEIKSSFFTWIKVCYRVCVLLTFPPIS
jgi:hypothetical protein